MIFKEFFESSLKTGIISQFNSLDLPSDIVIEYDEKASKEDKLNVAIYRIKNKNFSNNIMIKYNHNSPKYYISAYSDYEPDHSDDVVEYIKSKLSTSILVNKTLDSILDGIQYFNTELKEFDADKPVIDLDDIDLLNQIYKLLNIPKEIVVDRTKPYATWMFFKFFVIDDLDEIVQWIKEQLNM